MKYEIITDNNGLIVLTHNDRIIVISRRMARVLDIIEDLEKNNGISTLEPTINLNSETLEG